MLLSETWTFDKHQHNWLIGLIFEQFLLEKWSIENLSFFALQVMVESINWVVCLSMDDLYLMWYDNELLSLLIMVWDPVTFQGNSESRTDASPKFSQGKQLKNHEFDPQAHCLKITLSLICIFALIINVQRKKICTQCLKITEKSLIQHYERSELRLHFALKKVN